MSIFSKLFTSSNQTKPKKTKYDLNSGLDTAYLLGILTRQIMAEGRASIGGELNRNEIVIWIHGYELLIDLFNSEEQLRSNTYIQSARLLNGEYLNQISYESASANEIKVKINEICTVERVKEIAQSFVRGCNDYYPEGFGKVMARKDNNNAESCSYSIDIG